MTSILKLLRTEEGFSAHPYRDTEGYPTVGYGFKIGPKGAALANYAFDLPRHVADLWLETLMLSTMAAMLKEPLIASAWNALDDDSDGADNDARKAVLVSMAYQMGPQGLAKFKTTLRLIAAQSFSQAGANMLKSRWATQTPARAKRHAQQMATGVWDKEYSK